MKTNGINFSPKYSRGSVAKRSEFVRKVRDNIFDNILNQYYPPKSDSNAFGGLNKIHYIPISNLDNFIKDLLPERLKFNLKKTPPKTKEYIGELQTRCSENGVSYYSIEIPAKKNHLYINDIPYLMHEITHLLDSAINPQYKISFEKLAQKKLAQSAIALYENVYYTNDKYNKFNILKKTYKVLKNLLTEDKLLILKFIELELKTEINAYGCMKKYIDDLRKNHQCRISYNKKAYNSFNFEKKLKLVEKLRNKIILNERKKQRKSLG